jgi:hypothetical protein
MADKIKGVHITLNYARTEGVEASTSSKARRVMRRVAITSRILLHHLGVKFIEATLTWTRGPAQIPRGSTPRPNEGGGNRAGSTKCARLTGQTRGFIDGKTEPSTAIKEWKRPESHKEE